MPEKSISKTVKNNLKAQFKMHRKFLLKGELLRGY